MRIAGITIPGDKRLEISLTAIFGVGRARARRILQDNDIDYGTTADSLNVDQENQIRRSIEEFKIEGDLKREISSNIKRLKDIKAYRGSRHTKGLPARGQRTKTNSRTRRGNVRKTMASGKRKTEKK